MNGWVIYVKQGSYFNNVIYGVWLEKSDAIAWAENNVQILEWECMRCLNPNEE